jgi:hypothetical protein
VGTLVALLEHPAVITPRLVVVLVRHVVGPGVVPQIFRFVVRPIALQQDFLVVIICTFAALGKVVVRVAVATSIL